MDQPEIERTEPRGEIDWIAIDWGTTRLRVWALDAAGTVLGRAESADGMGMMAAAADYESALLSLAEPWLRPDRPTLALACGMVGSRQGWIEVPYSETPCAPSSTPLAAPVRDPRLSVWICPGVCQSLPPDVMRGEETQLAGLLSAEPDFAGAVCLPGTHSKWVVVHGGRIASFATFLTGELFELLARHSVLRHTLTAEGWDEAAFLAGLGESLEDPVTLSARLFSLRAEPLLHGLDAKTARSRLSGWLVGWELAAARAYWEAGKVALVGAAELSSGYASALRACGVEAQVHNAERLTLAGLAVARSKIV